MSQEPKISWINIKIDSPIIYIYFHSDFILKNELKNIWLNISIPYYVLSLNAEWSEINDC